MKQRSILVVEDDEHIANVVALHLRDAGYRVTGRRHGLSGYEEALAQDYDLIILDLMLPGMGGLDICRRLRAETRYAPILMLTARSAEVDRVLGLEIGADDYLTKPFSVHELVARVKALFRRVDALAARDGERRPEALEVGPVRIDVATREVTVEGKAVTLTAREFDLLLHFASNPRHVFSRSQLLDDVWGNGYDGYEHTVNSHINRLRNKIEKDPAHPKLIVTVWGVGYRLGKPEEIEESKP
ncbi:MAG: response regulator transcription factor [Candidatus Schekmanbacteria bacterium]|nr:response regulator transcription factor [Candidatus Schekmanbacteria bacterium]